MIQFKDQFNKVHTLTNNSFNRIENTGSLYTVYFYDFKGYGSTREPNETQVDKEVYESILLQLEKLGL